MCNLTKLAGAASISCYAGDRKNQDQVSVAQEMVSVLKNTIRSKIHLIKGRDHSILFRTWQVSTKIRHFRGKGLRNFRGRKIGLSKLRVLVDIRALLLFNLETNERKS